MFTIEAKWFHQVCGGRMNMDDPQRVGQCQSVSMLSTWAPCGNSSTARESLGGLPSDHPRERYFKLSVKALGDDHGSHTARTLLKLCISWLLVVVLF